MSFKDLDEFGEAPIVLPIRGRDFTFPGSVSARIGLILQRTRAIATQLAKGEIDPDTEAISDAESDAVNAALLGEAAEDLLDYATTAEYNAVLRCLFNAQVYGREFAERIWNQLGEAPAPSPKPAAKKSPGRARGSRGGSTSRPRRKAAQQPGQTSSPAGDS